MNSYGKLGKAKLWNENELTWTTKDVQTPFRELLNQVNAVEGIDRIRFTSSNPHDMTKDILDAHFELPKMCPYLHFAMQSGSDDVLKRMNRKHTFNEFYEMVAYLRSKDPLFSISTDIIVGFPGETEAEFLQTVEAFEKCEFDFSYNARYSPRVGTISEKLMQDNVSYTEKAKRWDIVNSLLLKSVQKRNALMLGRTEAVLVEKINTEEHTASGRTRNFKEVFFAADESVKVGDLVPVQITEIDRWILRGLAV